MPLPKKPSVWLVLCWTLLSACNIRHTSCSSVRATLKHRELEEGEHTVCEDVEPFESYVRVEFTGSAGKVTPQEKRVLERIFGWPYKKLTRTQCIKNYREIEEADIVQEVQSQETLASEQSFTYYFRVTGDCECCGSSKDLFGTDRGFDLQQTNLWRKWKQHRKDKLVEAMDAETTCQGKNEEPALCECSAPPAAVFADMYNAIVQKLRASGRLTNVDTVSAVSVVTEEDADFPVNDTEIQPVTCSEEVFDFETTVFILLKRRTSDTRELDDGSRSLFRVPEDDLVVLGESYRDTYNELSSSQYCDPLFRKLVNVNFTQVEDSDQSNRMLKPRLFEGTVTGSSRGRRARRAFDDTSGRRMASTESPHGNLRRLDGHNACFCPVDPVAQRAPSTNEFRIPFQETVRERIQDPVYVVAEITEPIPS